MKNTSISFQVCDFSNPLHTSKLVELLNHYISDPMGGDNPLDADHQEMLIQGLASNPKASVVFMKYETEFAGYVTLFELFSTFKTKPYLYIHDFFILNTYRGQKLGYALMNEVVRIAEEKDCCSVSLEVRVDNHAAKKLYQTCGFLPCDPDMFFWKKHL